MWATQPQATVPQSCTSSVREHLSSYISNHGAFHTSSAFSSHFLWKQASSHPYLNTQPFMNCTSSRITALTHMNYKLNPSSQTAGINFTQCAHMLRTSPPLAPGNGTVGVNTATVRVSTPHKLPPQPLQNANPRGLQIPRTHRCDQTSVHAPEGAAFPAGPLTASPPGRSLPARRRLPRSAAATRPGQRFQLPAAARDHPRSAPSTC